MFIYFFNFYHKFLQVSDFMPLRPLTDSWRSYALRSPRKRREAVFFPQFTNQRFRKESLVHNLVKTKERKPFGKKETLRKKQSLKERRKKERKTERKKESRKNFERKTFKKEERKKVERKKKERKKASRS